MNLFKNKYIQKVYLVKLSIYLLYEYIDISHKFISFLLLLYSDIYLFKYIIVNVYTFGYKVNYEILSYIC